MNDSGSGKALTLQEKLYRFYREGIESGRLADQLPSKSAAALAHGVGKVTIEKVYAQLLLEGYIRSQARRGYFVDFKMPAPAALPPAAAAPSRPAAAEPACLYDLTTTSVAPDALLPDLWNRLLRKTVSENGAALLAPTPVQGLFSLREQIAACLLRYRRLRVDPAQIIIGAGSEWLFTLMIQLIGLNRRYAVETPGYRKIRNIFAAHGLDPVFLPVQPGGWNLATLASTRPDVIHITPSHQFPLGLVMPARSRAELLAQAARDNFFIIEDDYDCEYRFHGHPVPALLEMDRQGRVIYVNTFARTLTPALRLSYMVLPPELLQRYTQKFSFYSCTVPAFEQYVLEMFLREGHFRRHLQRMKALYCGVHEALLHALQHSPLAPRLRLSGTRAGLHFLLQRHGDMSEQEMVSRARQAGIRLHGLSAFYEAPMDAPPATVLIGLTGISAAAAGDLVGRLSAAWN